MFVRGSNSWTIGNEMQKCFKFNISFERIADWERERIANRTAKSKCIHRQRNTYDTYIESFCSYTKSDNIQNDSHEFELCEKGFRATNINNRFGPICLCKEKCREKSRTKLLYMFFRMHKHRIETHLFYNGLIKWIYSFFSFGRLAHIFLFVVSFIELISVDRHAHTKCRFVNMSCQLNGGYKWKNGVVYVWKYVCHFELKPLERRTRYIYIFISSSIELFPTFVDLVLFLSWFFFISIYIFLFLDILFPFN